jgi:hypothetical protein
VTKTLVSLDLSFPDPAVAFHPKNRQIKTLGGAYAANG